MKALKKVFGVVLALFFLLVLGIGALLWWVDLNDYKKEIEQLAAQQNVILKIEGDLGWTFYPALGVSSGKLSVLPPMEDLSAPIEFEKLNLSVRIIPLFKGEVLVNTVRLQGGNLVLQTKGSKELTRIQNLQLTADGLNLQQQPFHLNMALQVSSEMSGKTTQAIDIKSKMEVTLEKTFQKVSIMNGHHDITFTGEAIQNKTVLITADFPAVIDLAASSADINNLTIKLDDTRITGQVQASFGATPLYKIKLMGDSINLDRYVASTDAPDDGEISSTAGSQTPVIPAAMVLAFPGDYDISFQKMITNRMTLSDVHLVANITADGLMTIKPLNLHLYDGDLNLQGRVDVRAARPLIQLNMSLSPMQLEPALKDFMQVDKTFASGDLAVKSEITTQGLTTDDFIKALAGKFSFASQTITLNKIDLTSSLNASLLQLLQMKLPALMASDNQTVMTELIGEGNIQKGVVTPHFSAKALCTQFSGDGSYDISQSGIDYQLGVSFPSEDEAKTCASINPRLKDIAWPITCQGALADDPAKLCRADTKKIQSIVAKTAGKEASQKLEKKIDETLKKKFGEDSDQVKGLLKDLLH